MTATYKPPKGFKLRTQDGKYALVRPEYGETLSAALFEGSGCEAWNPPGGRGAIWRFPLDDGWGVIRRYRRGGAMRFLARDAYLVGNRPRCELDVLARLHAAGMPVPEPLGACWERRWGLLRGALAVRLLDACDLAVLAAQSPEAAADAAREAGRLIRRMHDLGVFHADLNIRNVLAGDSGVYLIDFDKARVSVALSPWQRARNLLRLRRSIEKLGPDSRLFSAVCEGYGAEEFPCILDWAYRAKGRVSDAMRGRKSAKPS